jgi:hypothetical protein
MDALFRRIKLGTTNMQAAEMMGLYLNKAAKKKPAPKPMPMRGERTAKNAAKKAKK